MEKQLIVYKEDLINMVKGSAPYYDVFDNELVKKTGEWLGGFHDKWVWSHSKLETLTEDELVELYYICKNSWKK